MNLLSQKDSSRSVALPLRRIKSQEDIDSTYTRLSHYINTMAGNGHSNTKLEFAVHAECRSIVLKYTELKDDYLRCIDMMKELKNHNIAVHTDMAQRLTVSETNAEDLRIQLKETTKNVGSYESDAKRKSALIETLHGEIAMLKLEGSEQKVVVEDLQNTLARKQAVRMKPSPSTLTTTLTFALLQQHDEHIRDLKRPNSKEIDQLRDQLSTTKNEKSLKKV